MTMWRMSCHAEGPEADAGCDQVVNASECCPVDADSRAAWSRGVVAPGPAGKGSNPENGGTTAGRDTGALMREETIVLPSDCGAKTALLMLRETRVQGLEQLQGALEREECQPA